MESFCSSSHTSSQSLTYRGLGLLNSSASRRRERCDLGYGPTTVVAKCNRGQSSEMNHRKDASHFGSQSSFNDFGFWILDSGKHCACSSIQNRKCVARIPDGIGNRLGNHFPSRIRLRNVTPVLALSDPPRQRSFDWSLITPRPLRRRSARMQARRYGANRTLC